MIQVSLKVEISSELPRLSDSAWRAFLPRARAVLSQFEAERFQTSTAPDGTPWQPLRARTLEIAREKAIEKLGGQRANPAFRRDRQGRLIAYARNPLEGYQRTAVVRRTERSKILVDTGRLRQSVVANAASADAVREARQYELLWGTRVPYAQVHQYGTARVPARPFLGESPELLRRLQLELREAYRRGVGGL